MLRVLVFTVGFAIAGLIVGLNIETTPQPAFADMETMTQKTPVVNSSPTEHLQRLDELEQKLARETLAREDLAKQLAALQTQLSQLQLSKQTADIDHLEQASVDIQATDAAPAELTMQTADTFSAPTSRSTEEVLLAIGLDETTAQQLKKREEAQEMDMLYLRNKATREGWFGTEKYFQETQKLQRDSNIYRQELGDDNYDRYLYESDQFNRVQVRSVISNSPAEIAGIQAGDIIYRYDNKRIFSWNELTSLTAGGESGQSVSLEIVRGQQPINLAIPRGPMGIRLSGLKIDPDNS